MKTAEHIIETVDKLVRKYHTRDPYELCQLLGIKIHYYQNPLLRFTEEIEGLLLLPVQTEEYRDRSQCERHPGTYLSRT